MMGYVRIQLGSPCGCPWVRTGRVGRLCASFIRTKNALFVEVGILAFECEHPTANFRLHNSCTTAAKQGYFAPK